MGEQGHRIPESLRLTPGKFPFLGDNWTATRFDQHCKARPEYILASLWRGICRFRINKETETHVKWLMVPQISVAE